MNFANVAAGDNFSLALTHDRGYVYSFGRCGYGQLGIGLIGDKAALFYPTPQVVKFPKVVQIDSIGAGDRQGFAMTTNHELYSWGFNSVGTTGHQLTNTNVPDNVADVYRPTLLKFDVQPACYPVQCSIGGQHALVLVRPKTHGNISN